MAKNKTKILKKQEEIVKEDNNESGVGLDDAFSDDEDVTYAESKPRKVKKKTQDELEEEIEEAEEKLSNIQKDSIDQKEVTLKASKPVSKIKKGDKIRVDGKELVVDSHYVLIDHKSTKEMTIELYDPKTDKDYQLRYFDDQVDSTLEFYELQEIMYIKKPISQVSW